MLLLLLLACTASPSSTDHAVTPGYGVDACDADALCPNADEVSKLGPTEFTCTWYCALVDGEVTGLRVELEPEDDLFDSSPKVTCYHVAGTSEMDADCDGD